MPEPKRVYPQRIGLQLLGATDPDGNGIAGAEKSLDGLLHGTAGQRVVLRDRAGQVVRVEHERPSVAGKTVGLTVDRDIQSAAENIAAQTLVKWKAKAVTIVALDPSSGSVLAMASAPGVPTGGYSKATQEEQRLRAVADGYEPGSTFKVVTIGAALQEGRVTPETRFTVPYSMSLYDRQITDADHHGTESLSVSDILAQSSNVGTVTIARTKLGATALSRWIGKLGFGQATGVDLPGEFPGGVLPLHKWSGTSILSFPIGEGVLVTPAADGLAVCGDRRRWGLARTARDRNRDGSPRAAEGPPPVPGTTAQRFRRCCSSSSPIRPVRVPRLTCRATPSPARRVRRPSSTSMATTTA